MERNSGQSLLVVLFIAMVGLTVAVSIFTETLNDLALTKTEENSERAFKAAEAGIEHYLSGSEGSFNSLNETTVSFPDGEKGTPQDYFEINLKAGEVAQIDLEENASSVVQICWNGESSIFLSKWMSESAAEPVEYVLLENDNDNMEFGGEQGVNISRFSIDGLSSYSGSNGEIYGNTYTISDLTNIEFLRLKIINGETSIFSDSSNSVNGIYKLSASAQVSTGETRKIEVDKTEDFLPEIFDYVLFAKSGVSK